MFRIDLAIADAATLVGLQALDECRRLGLPDNSILYVCDKRTSVWFTVTEQFARKHFPYCVREMSTEVPLGALTRDDVVLDKDILKINEEMSNERAMELFAAHYTKEDVSCSG